MSAGLSRLAAPPPAASPAAATAAARSNIPARRELAGVKSELVKERGMRAPRIKVADGGHREWSEMELWIVPPGGRAPVPTAFPKGRR